MKKHFSYNLIKGNQEKFSLDLPLIIKRREFGCVDLYRSDGTAYTSEGISTYKILWFAGNKNI